MAVRFTASAVVLTLLLSGCTDRADRVVCFGAADSLLGAGWRHYQATRIGDAERAFAQAAEVCPTHPEAKTGLGYVALRAGNVPEARRLFEEALAEAPGTVDALVGLGLAQWRDGDVRRARDSWMQAAELDPDNIEVREYLARFEGGDSSERARLSIPDTLVYSARVSGERFEVRDIDGWAPFYVRAVDLRTTIPGRFATEFPDSATYATWLRLIGAMGANSVRVHSVLPPSFYAAVLDYNRVHPLSPLWLIQGILVTEPPADDYGHPEWKGTVVSQAQTVVDVVHGRVDLPAVPGRAQGSYRADVSQWSLAWILEGSWEPSSIVAYNQLRPTRRSRPGQFLSVADASPMDVWLSEMMEAVVEYEAETYNAQRPIAYSNSPVTDPLDHPTEASSEEEAAIRRSLGLPIGEGETIGGDDLVGIDPSAVTSTERLEAGYFAAYDVYPFYPDFLLGLDESSSAARGGSSFEAYLRDLKQHHGELPVLVSGYGVPTSLGIGHIHPEGRHHGGHSEVRMAEIDAALTREIAQAGMAGGVLYQWLDDWSQASWIAGTFEVPDGRDRLWKNQMDPDEGYGIMAADPEPAVTGETFESRLASWDEIAPLYGTPGGTFLRAAADEQYVWLLVELGADQAGADEVLVGFDVLDPKRGDFAWPGSEGADLPIGLEFVLRIDDSAARIMVDPPVKQILVNPLPPLNAGEPIGWRSPRNPPRGFFSGRFQRRLNLPLSSEPNADGEFEPWRELPNRLRYGSDSLEYGAAGFEAGVLAPGAPPDGLWQRVDDRWEVRIPWQLLNFADPSRRAVLEHPAGWRGPRLQTVTVERIRMALAVRLAGELQSWPRPGQDEVATFTWDNWEEPRWRGRLRPVYHSVRRAWSEIRPRVIAQE